MKASSIVRRSATVTVVVVVALITMTGALLASVNAGYGRSLLIHYAAAHLGRSIEVKGTLRARLFSLRPELVVEGVTIGNPSWMPAGVAAEIGRLSLTLAWPGSTGGSGIERLELQEATFHLQRDARGGANWQATAPDQPLRARHSRIIRSLSIPHAHVVLADAYFHRQFIGTVSADGPAGPGDRQPVRIEGTGQLNGRPVSFKLTAESLATASHDHPYRFVFAEHSSGSRLEVRGLLPRPFDFTSVDASVDAAGPDLHGLYFLTGASLLHTGPFRLSAKATRRGRHTDYRDLAVTSGQSEVHGHVSIDYSKPRRKVELSLESQALNVAEFGHPAAAHTAGSESPLLLSNIAFSPRRIRADDATLVLRAQTVAIGRLTLHEVSVKATIDHGVLKVTPLLAEVAGGRIDARLSLDASRKVPAANLELSIVDLQLAQLPYKEPGPPPIEGPLRARVMLTGAGTSLHEMASGANGTVRLQLPEGAVRASFAELAGGIDLRALGLLLTHDKREVPIRCGTASLKAEAGTLTAQTLVADTDPVLVTGEGQIHLDTETLDLVLHGDAKRPRLFRLRAPVLVQGTLAHPSIHIQKDKAVPLIVDTAKARDVDCPALLGEPI